MLEVTGDLLQTSFDRYVKRPYRQIGYRLSEAFEFAAKGRKGIELSNGIPAVVERRPDDFQAELYIKIGSGSIADPPGKEGLAHFAEHMILLGTTRARKIYEQLRQMGVNINGRTHAMDTEYQFSWDSETIDNHEVTKLISELIFEAQNFDKHGFELQRDRILSELKVVSDRSNIFAKVLDRLRGTGSTIAGSIDTISKITLEDIETFIKAHYVTANTHIYMSNPNGANAGARTLENNFGYLKRSRPVIFERNPSSFPEGYENIPDNQLEDTETMILLNFESANLEEGETMFMTEYIKAYLERQVYQGDKVREYGVNFNEIPNRATGISAGAFVFKSLPERAHELSQVSTILLNDLKNGHIDIELAEIAKKNVIHDLKLRRQYPYAYDDRDPNVIKAQANDNIAIVETFEFETIRRTLMTAMEKLNDSVISIRTMGDDSSFPRQIRDRENFTFAEFIDHPDGQERTNTLT